MFKQKLKLFCVVLSTILLLSTLSFATDDSMIQPRTTSEEVNSVSEENAITTDEIAMPTITSDDLYLMDSDVIMDELVEGNVYLFGSNITITGQVAGNLFAFGNNITFDPNCVIMNSVYVFGNTVSISGQMTDLYIACSTCTVSENTNIYRDFRCYSNITNFSGTIQRNAFIMAQKLNFAQNGNFMIAGNLNYYCPEEVDIPTQASVQGKIVYKPISNSNDNKNAKSFSDYIVSFCTYILTAIALYLFFAKATPKFIKNSSNFASTKSLLALAIGFLVLIGIPLFILILFMISIGVTLGFILLALYIALLLCASSVVSIAISKKVIEVRKIDNNYMNILVVALVSALVWVIKSLPFVGGILNFVIILVGLGIITMSVFAKKDENAVEKVVEETK